MFIYCPQYLLYVGLSQGSQGTSTSQKKPVSLPTSAKKDDGKTKRLSQRVTRRTSP